MSNNYKGNIEEDLFQESLVEILELIENVEYAFLNLERSQQELNDEELYEILMRDIHSIKGSLGMIGLHSYMEDIHKVETFLINNFNENCIGLEEVSIQAEYWSSIYSLISNSEFNLPKKNTFNLLRTNGLSLLKTSAHTPENNSKPKILFLGNKGILNTFFNDNKIDFKQLNCVNEVYKSSTFEEVKYIICHLPCLRVNPFLLQEIIHKFHDKTRICYIYDSKQELIDFLEEAGKLKISFKLFSKNAKDYQNALLNHIRNQNEY